MKQKLIFLLLRLIVTVAVMLLSCGYIAIYQAVQDCTNGNPNGATLFVAVMGITGWLSSTAVIHEMRTSQGKYISKGKVDTYDN